MCCVSWQDIGYVRIVPGSKSEKMLRRSFLGTCATSLLTASGLDPMAVISPGRSDGLVSRASRANLVYGAATGVGFLKDDPEFKRAFCAECGLLVTESELQWKKIASTPDTLQLLNPDWLLNFAASNNLYFRGHSLLWHHAVPIWFTATVTARNVHDVLVSHIQRVVGHFAGRASSWDVVNEVVSPFQQRPDGLDVRAPWLELMGPEYIDLAFRTASEADPHALMVLNQNNLEYDTPVFDRIRGNVLRLLDRLKGKNVPVQALGIQGHLAINKHPFNAAKFSRFMNEVSSMGLRILITEMDVAEDSDGSNSEAERDQKVADAYSQFLAPVLDNKSVIAVLTWGLCDRYTWLSSYARRSDGQPVRPLPLDHSMNRKPAWHSIANAFDNAPPDRDVYLFNKA